MAKTLCVAWLVMVVWISCKSDPVVPQATTAAVAMPSKAEAEEASAKANAMLAGTAAGVSRAEATRVADVLNRLSFDAFSPPGDIASMATTCGPCMSDTNGCRFAFCSVYICVPGFGCTWRTTVINCGSCAANPKP